MPDGTGRWLRGKPGSKCAWPLVHPVYPLGPALPSLGSVMSPDVLLGLGCCPSGFMFSVAVEGGAFASSSPPSTEGPRGGSGRFWRSGGDAELQDVRLGISPLSGCGAGTGTSSRLTWAVPGTGKSAGNAFF